MRKFLVEVIIIAAALSISWIFAGRQLARWIDRFTLATVESADVTVIGYHGSGDGGLLALGSSQFTLAPLNPHIGTTKDNQLAIAYAKKVFAFGSLTASQDQIMFARIPKSDSASLVKRRGFVPWISFESSPKPRLNRTTYYELSASKSDGTKLDMLWSTGADEGSTSLIRVDISNAAR